MNAFPALRFDIGVGASKLLSTSDESQGVYAEFMHLVEVSTSESCVVGFASSSIHALNKASQLPRYVFYCLGYFQIRQEGAVKWGAILPTVRFMVGRHGYST